MPEASRTAQLEREARTFSRYLAGREPGEAVVRAYVDHGLRFDPGPADLLDRALLGLARTGTAGTRVADVYAGRFRRSGALRRRLVLTLAALESTDAASALLEEPPGEGPALAWGRLFARAAGEGVVLLLSLPLLGPVHLCSAIRGSSAR